MDCSLGLAIGIPLRGPNQIGRSVNSGSLIRVKKKIIRMGSNGVSNLNGNLYGYLFSIQLKKKSHLLFFLFFLEYTSFTICDKDSERIHGA